MQDAGHLGWVFDEAMRTTRVSVIDPLQISTTSTIA